jgi:prophage regulatory protein
MPKQETPYPLLRLEFVLSRLGISKSAFYRLHDFPKPVRLGPRSPRWYESEVDAYIAAHRERQRKKVKVRHA